MLFICSVVPSLQVRQQVRQRRAQQQLRECACPHPNPAGTPLAARQTAIRRGPFSAPQEFDAWVRPEDMLGPK